MLADSFQHALKVPDVVTLARAPGGRRKALDRRVKLTGAQQPGLDGHGKQRRSPDQSMLTHKPPGFPHQLAIRFVCRHPRPAVVGERQAGSLALAYHGGQLGKQPLLVEG
ncbi:MAG: hypothetical protein MUF10_16900, partial [Thermoanaerobaculaceae bacterium]|nr:hypothetical protein [Thermoanaerobaculaceae bacterium]